MPLIIVDKFIPQVDTKKVYNFCKLRKRSLISLTMNTVFHVESPYP